MDFTTPAGKRIRRSAQTADRRKAQELHDTLKAEYWRTQVMKAKPAYTWDEAGYKWLMETKHKRSHRDDVLRLAWLQEHLRGQLLASITRDQIIAIAEIKRTESSPSTANRVLALLRAILRRACFEWEWIDRVPKIKLYPEPKRRVRWIEPDQVKTLLAERLPYQRDMVLFSLATGLRQSNVRLLSWEQVDLERRTLWIPESQAKAGEDIHVSLSEFAVELLRRQEGKHPNWVFTREGKPIKYVNTKYWRDAVKRAGIQDFRWHDLRHTWASWLVQNGTPLYTLQEMGGWKSSEMVRRYAHLSPAHMASHAEIVGRILYGTNTSQPDSNGPAPSAGVPSQVPEK
ncbi:tyrosine-type recombinase/integrase [Massilia sp. TS11]|uniref:tyrosine-type recombinase/integrase n=1 Tax=Massilia sp. TS11 TaxID=2908003 RepID=UPI0035A2FA89